MKRSGRGRLEGGFLCIAKNSRPTGYRAVYDWVALHLRTADSSGLKGILSAGLLTKAERKLLILEVYGTE